MNWLLIIIGGLILGSVILGCKRGFLRTAFSLVAWIAVLLICHYVTPIVVDYVMEETAVASIIEEQVSEKLSETIGEETYGLIETMLPEELREGLETESTEIVTTILSFVVSIVIIIVARLLVQIIDMVLGIASKLPLIGSVDKLLGAILGGIKGYVWASLVLVIITMLALTGTNTELIVMINDSEILTWFYENNFLIRMIMESR